MNWFPVISRELKAEGRHPLTYWLRLTTALLLLALLIVLADDFRLGQGGVIFNQLNLGILVAIWVIVPLLTGDCLSRERREGTLGLLFLTPLKPVGIVIGKGLTHALRGLSFVLVAFPILAVPILLGGVNGPQIVQAMLKNGTALFLALSSGLFASACCREWNRALLLAEILSALYAFVLYYLRDRWFIPSPMTVLPPGVTGPYAMFLASRVTVRLRLWHEFALLAGAILFFLVTVWAAASLLKKTWQDDQPSRQKLWLLRIFCTPVLLPAFFRRNMRRKLNQNPIGWLQYYSWSARLSKWGWFMLVSVLETYMLIAAPGLVVSSYWVKPQLLLINLIGLGLAFSAVGSFRREKLNGALELLLVSPLREIQIVLGRLCGIWSQFLPTVLFLCFIWIVAFERYDYGISEGLEKYAFPIKCALVLLCVPVIGFYLSLHRFNFLFGWVVTCLIGLGLPIMVRMGFHELFNRTPLSLTVVPLGSNGMTRVTMDHQAAMMGLFGEWAIQVVSALICLGLLWRNLKRRSFALLPA